MSYTHIVVMYTDYVEDMPEFAKKICIKNGKDLPVYNSDIEDHHNYYYLLALTLEVNEKLIKMSVLRNQPDGENDCIDLYVPTSAVKCILEY